MFTAAFDRYILTVAPSSLPEGHDEYLRRASLVEQFDLSNPEGTFCFIGAGLATDDWPRLVIEQRYSPAGYGFLPGVLLAHDTDVLFVGAGTRLLAYRVSVPARLWEDDASCGFFSWERHGRTVLMLAELELAAWAVTGEKLWSFPVEPPWSHSVTSPTVTVDVMGTITTFSLTVGPRTAT